ncbi:SDR family oxidoreductase [Streptomyces sp. NPDC059881]|uniref:SDR family oxidoreductase n=1 Tax=Streptomyces sp. NPDC059881 TaxID=3346986 RepID=UPI003663DAFF
MKFAVLGGRGRIGSQVVDGLTAAGHDVKPASLSTGLDVVSGKGLEEALAGADVVINLTNSPSFDDTSIDFFETSMSNIGAAAEAAGVRHFVILSIIGVDQVPVDYYRAKVAQEHILENGPTPYSIVRVTQFFEFIGAIMSWTTEGDAVHLPSTPVQPIAAADVAAAVVRAATGPPLQGIHNVAGPEVFTLDELGRITLEARPDGDRHVVTDDQAGMFAEVSGDVLIAPKGTELAPTHYRDWLRQQS